MRSASFYALVVSVTSVFCQHQQLRYAKNLRKAVPPHYNHDQKITGQSLDKVPRGHKIEPYEPPLRPHQAVPWQRWVHEGRWAAQADKNRELLKVRAHLLAEKLKPIKPAFKPRILPQLKPKLNQKENARLKREVEKNQIRFQKGIDNKGNIRRKREILTSEAMAQPQIEAKMSSPDNQYEDLEKREKRQILYFINRPPQMLARIPRTTPNPFIRDTHIEDYDIIRPEVGEREGMIRTLESGSSDPSTYPLMNEDSTEFTKIISQFYLTTSEEHWPEIQHFADNILKPISQLNMKKHELIKALKRFEDTSKMVKTIEQPSDVVQMYQIAFGSKDIENVIHNRVKRRVNKTLQRKRAKKKKQRLRRFERKRLRMLTHARRVRRQQKSKQARLQRHYARMNMSTTETPEHLRNQTSVDKEEEDDDEDKTKSKDEEEYEEETEEEDEEYESSEYEDESEEEESKSDSVDSDEKKTSSKGRKQSEASDESDKSEREESELGSKPDYGNDDYEEYEDDSDDYEDDESSIAESEKKKKKSGKEKNLKAMRKAKKQTMKLNNYHNLKKEHRRTNPKTINLNKKNPQVHSIISKSNPKNNDGQIYNEDFKRCKELMVEKQTTQIHDAKIKILQPKMNRPSEHVIIGNRYHHRVHENSHTGSKSLDDKNQWIHIMGNKKLSSEGKFQSFKI